MKKIHAFLAKISLPNWLVILLFIVLILRIPSFFEPYYYGDEMIYLTLGQGIRQGVPLYSGLHDNKPPILYLIAAAAGNLVWFKIFLAITGIVAIVFFAKIVKHLFANNTKVQRLATLIFALLTTLPFLEGNIANAENFMMAFSLPAFYLLLTKKLKAENLMLAGFLFGLSSLTKIPALFDLPVVIVFWLISRQFKFKKTLWILVGFLTPIALSFLWFFSQGALADYLRAAFLENIGYVSSWRPGDVQKSFLVRNLPFFIRAALVLVGLATLFKFHKRLTPPFILASVWTLLALFAATLSERPYPHYLLQTAAPASILLGILLADKSLTQSLTVIPLFLTFLVPVFYKFWYYPTVSYYLHFARFTVGLDSKEKYFSQFGHSTNRNYLIADFLVNSSRLSDRVFVWGPDSPAIYALSRRLPPIKFTADYHVRDFSSQAKVTLLLSQNKPKFIILSPEAKAFAELNPLLKTSYLLINRIEAAEIWIKSR